MKLARQAGWRATVRRARGGPNGDGYRRSLSALSGRKSSVYVRRTGVMGVRVVGLVCTCVVGLPFAVPAQANPEPPVPTRWTGTEQNPGWTVSSCDWVGLCGGYTVADTYVRHLTLTSMNPIRGYGDLDAPGGCQYEWNEISRKPDGQRVIQENITHGRGVCDDSTWLVTTDGVRMSGWLASGEHASFQLTKD